MVLVLADVKPFRALRLRKRTALLEPRIHANVDPVARQLLQFAGVLSDPGLEEHHAVAVQQRLEALDLGLVDGALGHEHDIDAPGLLARGYEHTVEKLQIEPLLGRELVEAERFLLLPLQRTLEHAEVRLPHLQGPGQQQQVGVLGAAIGAAMARRHLVPVSLYAGPLHARVA